MTSRSDDPNANGWGGRIADLLYSSNSGQVPMSITLSGQNRFQRGGTVNQFDVTFRKVGINPVFVNIGDHDAIRRAITPKTKCIFAETLGNPKIDVLDIEAVSAIAHDSGIPLVVDNTFASPYCCRPIIGAPTSFCIQPPSSSAVTAPPWEA
jgi:O-acetylhomoserine (thiol)-lyase